MDASWDDLRVFLAVARAASLSGAGRALRLDPATVGRRVARLEDRLGAALFVRTPKGYGLTEAGQRLQDHAERAEAACRAGAEAVAGTGDRLHGQIRVGAPDGCANYLLPQVFARLAAEHPALDLQILALPRVVNLSSREADMAITVSPPTAGRLTVQKIADYRLHLAASGAYLDGHGPILSETDLRGHRMIGYIPDMIFDAELDYLTGLGVERVALASNSIPVQLHLAAQGAGICVAHDFSVPFHPELKRFLTKEISLKRSFYLVRHQGDAQSQRLSRFARELNRALREEVRRLEALA